MHAGKNGNTKPGNLGLLTKIRTFTWTMMNPQVYFQSQQQDALLLLSRMFIFTLNTTVAGRTSHHDDNVPYFSDTIWWLLATCDH